LEGFAVVVFTGYTPPEFQSKRKCAHVEQGGTVRTVPYFYILSCVKEAKINTSL